MMAQTLDRKRQKRTTRFKLPRWLTSPPKGIVELSAYFLILVIGAADHLTGGEISLSLFYLVPVFLATWVLGRNRGLVMAMVASIVELAADLASGHPYANFLIVYWNSAVRLAFLLVLVALLGFLKKSLEAEEDSARTDFLTGVGNVRDFYETASAELLRAKRYRRPFTVVYLDLDDFKLINDRMGHHVGDKVLRCIAHNIQSSLRATDKVARLGGDEFVLLLPESDPDAAGAVVRRLHRRLRDVLRRNHWPVTVSMGTAAFLKPPATVDEMLRQADQLMYLAKRSGKNRIKQVVLR